MASVSPNDTGQVKGPPRDDAYTGMLIVSLAALLIGCLLLFLDYRRYPSKEPPPVAKSPAGQQGR
jgi:hypothetical protein